jgi:hypothetical protein
MKVVWNFEELPGGFVRVSISHHLDRKWLMIGPALTNWFAERFLIPDIAGRTLCRPETKGGSTGVFAGNPASISYRDNSVRSHF